MILEQASQDAFERLDRFISSVDASAENIGRVTAYIEDAGRDREVVYGPWTHWFPKDEKRPAFKVLDATLPPGAQIALDAVVCIKKVRTRVDIPGVDARDPTVRIGDWIFTSRLHGTSPQTGLIVEGLEERARQAVANGVDLVERAGGRASDVVQVSGYGNNLEFVSALTNAINEAFGAENKPLMHFQTTFVRPQVEVMTEFIACIGSHDRTNKIPVFTEFFSGEAPSNVPNGIRLGDFRIIPRPITEDSEGLSEYGRSTDIRSHGFSVQIVSDYP